MILGGNGSEFRGEGPTLRFQPVETAGSQSYFCFSRPASPHGELQSKRMAVPRPQQSNEAHVRRRSLRGPPLPAVSVRSSHSVAFRHQKSDGEEAS